jgi:hypothetical protein
MGIEQIHSFRNQQRGAMNCPRLPIIRFFDGHTQLPLQPLAA